MFPVTMQAGLFGHACVKLRVHVVYPGPDPVVIIPLTSVDPPDKEGLDPQSVIDGEFVELEKTRSLNIAWPSKVDVPVTVIVDVFIPLLNFAYDELVILEMVMSVAVIWVNVLFSDDIDANVPETIVAEPPNIERFPFITTFPLKYALPEKLDVSIVDVAKITPEIDFLPSVEKCVDLS